MARWLLLVLVVFCTSCSTIPSPKTLHEAEPPKETAACSATGVGLHAVNGGPDDAHVLAKTRTCVEQLALAYSTQVSKIDQDSTHSDLGLISLLGLATGAELFGTHRDVTKGLGLVSAGVGAGKSYLTPGAAAEALLDGASRLHCALNEAARLQEHARSFATARARFLSAASAGVSTDSSSSSLTMVLSSTLRAVERICHASTAYSLLAGSAYASSAYPATSTSVGAGNPTPKPATSAEQPASSHHTQPSSTHTPVASPGVNDREIARRLYDVGQRISMRTLRAFRGTRGDEAGFATRFSSLKEAFRTASVEQQAIKDEAESARALTAKSTTPLNERQVEDLADSVEAMATPMAEARTAAASLEACAE